MNKDDQPIPDHVDEANRPTPGRLGTDEKKISADLDRMFIESLLTHADSDEAFNLALADASLALPPPSEIDRVLGLTPPPELSQEEVAHLLSLDQIGDIAVDGMRLNELLDSSSISGAEERKMLKQGLVFLKRKKYAEAAEWWRLNRPDDELINGRLYLLLTLFLAITYKLAGNEAAAHAAINEARSSRHFKRRA